MRTLTHVRKAQLENGWKLTADGEPVEYAPRDDSDRAPFLNPRSGVRYLTRYVTAAPYPLAAGERLAVGLIMDIDEHSYHVLVRQQYRISDELTVCGRTAVSGIGHGDPDPKRLAEGFCRKCGRDGLREIALATAHLPLRAAL
jgi:hypothetical protein